MRMTDIKREDWEQRIIDQISYDPASGELTWLVNKRGGGAKVGRIVTRMNNYGYIVLTVSGRHLVGSRVAWFIHHGKWPDGEVDHCNGVRTDNRIVNLRDVTVTQNRQNCIGQPTKRKFSRFKGVGYDKRPRKWVARIVVNKKSIHLGSFDTEDQAAKAYETAEKQYFGQFASSTRDKPQGLGCSR